MRNADRVIPVKSLDIGFEKKNQFFTRTEFPLGWWCWNRVFGHLWLKFGFKSDSTLTRGWPRLSRVIRVMYTSQNKIKIFYSENWHVTRLGWLWLKWLKRLRILSIGHTVIFISARCFGTRGPLVPEWNATLTNCFNRSTKKTCKKWK